MFSNMPLTIIYAMKSTFLYKSLSSSHFCPEKNLRYTTDGSKNMKILKTQHKVKGPIRKI